MMGHAKTEEVEEHPPPKEEIKVTPQEGTIKWIQYMSEFEGHLPSPMNVSITGSTLYWCPELKWYNFDVWPHKIKLTNTGYTLLMGAKWRAERPYLEGGPLMEKHIFSQIHFHWGATLLEGSDHTVDKRRYPGEMQITFFRKEYMTQQEALKHPDGVIMVCYMIKHGVTSDERLDWVLEGFPRVIEAQTSTRLGPLPMSRLVPTFGEDYFLYWGALVSPKGVSHCVRWIIPRTTLYASSEQMKEFRKVWDPWDEPIKRNYRTLQERQDRHVFFINPHWCQYNSLLPIPRLPEEPITELSPSYLARMYLLPPQNAYMIPVEIEVPQEEELPPETIE